MFQEFIKGVAQVCQRCFKIISNGVQGVSRVSQWCLKIVSRLFLYDGENAYMHGLQFWQVSIELPSLAVLIHEKKCG